MIDLMMMASTGLETLALNGSTGALQRELTAASINSRLLTRDDFGNNAGGTNPTADVFVVRNGRPDYLAPSGVELLLGDNSRQDGSKWAMFEPFYYPDHFIIEYKDGRLERWDVGSSEGHCIPFQVKVVNNMVVRMDGTALGQQVNNGRCGDPMARAISAPAPPQPQPTQESCNAMNQILSGGACIPCTGNTPVRNGNVCEAAPVSNNNSSNNSNGKIAIVGGVGAVILAGWYFSAGSGVEGAFSYSPHYIYNLTDNGTAYSAGAKVNYHTDNVHLYWLVDTNNADSNIRFGTGFAYNGGFWNASFSEGVADDEVDYRFSLSANRRVTNWEFSSAYTLHSHFADISANWDNDIHNSLSLRANWRYNGWQIAPSTAYQWQNIRDIGSNHQFNLSATYEFTH